MFGELPKVFDRNFAISFFLPVTIFLIISYFLFSSFGLSQDIFFEIQNDIITVTTFLGVGSYVGGVLLLVINGDLYRIMSGYGKFNPLRIYSIVERRKYRRMISELKFLDQEIFSSSSEVGKHDTRDRERRNELMLQLASRYPDGERLLAPAPFGNTLRSVETYPRIMYGFDYVSGWSRLLTVIPPDYRTMIDTAKGQIDFWVNLCFLSFLLSLEIIFAGYTSQAYLAAWLLLGLIVAMIFFYDRASGAAIRWGEFEKSAFDVFRFDLYKKMEFKWPKKLETEQTNWTQFSQAVIYLRPDLLPEINQPPSQKARSAMPKNEFVNNFSPEVNLEKISPPKIKKRNRNS